MPRRRQTLAWDMFDVGRPPVSSSSEEVWLLPPPAVVGSLREKAAKADGLSIVPSSTVTMLEKSSFAAPGLASFL
jgi:hypothetical protein